MNKQDWIWVGFKLLGVYFIVNGLLYVPSAINYAISWKDPFVGVPALSPFIVALAMVAIYAVPGLYLLKGGKALLAWITPPEVSVETHASE